MRACVCVCALAFALACVFVFVCVGLLSIVQGVSSAANIEQKAVFVTRPHSAVNKGSRKTCFAI